MIYLVGQNIANDRLAEMIQSGEIPADIASLNLGTNSTTNLSPLSGLTSLNLSSNPPDQTRIDAITAALPNCGM